MMDDPVSFGSRGYLLMLGLLVFGARDGFSQHLDRHSQPGAGRQPHRQKTWLEMGIVAECGPGVALALWPLSAIVVATASVLVAARNFQSAWLMRSLGEDAYREWHVQRVQETPVTLHLFCLAGNTLLTAVVGAVLIGFSRMHLVPFAIGMGMVAYAVAVAFYSLLGIWRIHRATKREARLSQAAHNNHRRPAIWSSKRTRARPTKSVKLLAACIRRHWMIS